MRIYVQRMNGAIPGPKVILGDDAARVFIFGRSGGHPFAEQIVMLPRAETVQTRERGNRMVEQSWGVTRLHASIQDAELFTLDHPGEIPLRGRLTVVANDGGRRHMHGALVTATFIGMTGVETRWSYQVKGPPFVIANTEEEEE